MTEEETLELVRKELLRIFEEANNRSREGKGGFGTSTTDMLTGKGTLTEYLIQVVQERLANQSKTSNKQTKETGAKEKAISRWEGEGGAILQKKRELDEEEKDQIRNRIRKGDDNIYTLAQNFRCSPSQIAGIKARVLNPEGRSQVPRPRRRS